MDDRQAILAELRRIGMEDVLQSAIAAFATNVDGVPAGASRFGGNPELPVGVAWPARDGVPMQFVAQIRLADVAPFDVGAVLPKTGWLFFFHNEQWEYFTDGGYACCSVIHAETIGDPSAAPRVEIIDDFGPRVAPQVYATAALSFAETFSVPEIGAFVPPGKRDVWKDFLRRHAKGLPVGGHRLLGYLAQHDDLEAMSTEDVLLLQLGSDDACGFDWGKRWFLYFVMKKDDLARSDFSKVRVYRDIAC